MGLSKLFENKNSKTDSRTTNIAERNKIGVNLNFKALEAYKLLRTNLTFSIPNENNCKIIGYTSAVRGEGKSLSQINTAYVFAENKKKVLIVEADFRRPSIAEKLGVSIPHGLSDFLVSKSTEVESVIVTIQAGSGISFDIVSAGRIPPNPSELLDSNKMKMFIEKCAEKYDFIFIDLPPVTAVTDAIIVSKMVDGMVVVVRQDFCDEKSLNETIRQLKFVDAKILGFVFNGQNQLNSGRYRKYYKKDYYQEYSKAK